ncbi:concanavalin A-like lectin/glucanase domain-containing protein [Apiospora arundinis]|uniref:Concanavalin A-like lectin/glucanase domain-containing protein n=1 Tax=Apiospora arundinis TaxID=335852 RepID=A0ABR2J4F7_9PEZI
MPTRNNIYGILSVLGIAAQLAQGQLYSDCNPMLTDGCPAKKGWPSSNYFIDFTKETALPANWIMANYEIVNFNAKGAEFSFVNKGDAPNLWTDFYMLGGRYDVDMKIAPGVGVISSAVLWGDTLDEIDWEFSGNQFGNTPFPSADGMHVIQTNIFGQSLSWDGAATFEPWVHKPYEEFHTYSVEWDFDFIRWFVDGKVMREVRAGDIPSHSKMPQGPMKLQLGVWDGGDPDNSYWTKKWAGGETDLKGAPYTAWVRSVNITNKYPACSYKYNGKSGLRDSIQIIKDGCETPDAKKPTTSSAPSSVALPVSSATSSEEAVSLPNFQRQVGYSASPMPSMPSGDMPPEAKGSSSAPAAPESLPPMSSPPVSSVQTTPPEAKGSSSAPVPGESSPASSLPEPNGASQSTHLSSSAVESSYAASGLPSSNTGDSYVASGMPSSVAAGGSYVASGMPSSIASAPSTLIISSVASSALLSSDASSHVSSSASLESSSVMSSGPSTSTGGLLSSLSSLILGTTSSSSSSYAASSIETGTVTGASSVVSGSASITSHSAGSSIVSGSASYSGSISESSQMTSSASASGSSSSLPSNVSNSGSVIEGSNLITTLSISTIYSTNIYTITSCAPEVKDCPGKGAVTTELISIATTICPVTLTPGNAAAVLPTSSAPTSVPEAVSSSSSSALSMLSSASSALSSVAATASSSMSNAISSFSSSVADLSSSSLHTTSSNESTMAPSMASSSAAAAPSPTMPTTYSVSSQVITSSISTVYSTNIYTVTSCAPEVTNCPIKGEVTTELVSLYTTICPVTNKILDGITYPQVNAIVAAPTSSVVASSAAPGVSSSPVTSSMPESISASAPLSGSSSLSSEAMVSSSAAAPGSSAAPSSPPPMTTSTVFTSSVYTVSSCAPGAAECSSMMGSVTTEQVALYTTVCPVKETSKPPPPPPEVPTSAAAPAISPVVAPAPYLNSSAPLNTSGPLATSQVMPQNASSVIPTQAPVFTTSTVFSTNIYTVTSCGPEVKNCPAKLGEVTTEIIALSTTVCPVTQSSIAPVAPVAGAPKDVPSYQYSAASSTAAMGISPSAPLVVASPSSSHPPALTMLTVVPAGKNNSPQNAPKQQQPEPAPAAPGQDTQHLTKTMTNQKTVFGAGPSAQPKAGEAPPASQAPAPSQAPGAPPVVQAPAAPGGPACPPGCEPKTVYVTVTAAAAPAPPAVTVTVQPPFPMSSGMGSGTIGGTGVMPGTGGIVGTGTGGQMYAATTMPISGGGGGGGMSDAPAEGGGGAMTMTTQQPVAAYRRWFRREHMHRRHHH